MATIAFLGAGNIAQAIMGGLLQASNATDTITAFDPVAPCRESAEALGAQVRASNADAIKDADIIMLCVKPNVLIDLLAELSSDIQKGQMLISVAAGITTQSMQAALPTDTPIVRCMPNTPALVQAGMTAMFATKAVSEAQKTAALAVLSAVGESLWVEEESELDAVTAVSGSGPAYYFLMMELMIEAAMSQGLSKQVAQKLVLQTAYGASKMAMASNDDPATLRKNVTSPGGTTQAALEHFSQMGLGTIVADAVNAAKVRSEELSKQ